MPRVTHRRAQVAVSKSVKAPPVAQGSVDVIDESATSDEAESSSGPVDSTGDDEDEEDGPDEEEEEMSEECACM
jgi:hypothetical protein